MSNRGTNSLHLIPQEQHHRRHSLSSLALWMGSHHVSSSPHSAANHQHLSLHQHHQTNHGSESIIQLSNNDVCKDEQAPNYSTIDTTKHFDITQESNLSLRASGILANEISISLESSTPSIGQQKKSFSSSEIVMHHTQPVMEEDDNRLQGNAFRLAPLSHHPTPFTQSPAQVSAEPGRSSHAGPYSAPPACSPGFSGVTNLGGATPQHSNGGPSSASFPVAGTFRHSADPTRPFHPTSPIRIESAIPSLFTNSIPQEMRLRDRMPRSPATSDAPDQYLINQERGHSSKNTGNAVEDYHSGRATERPDAHLTVPGSPAYSAKLRSQVSAYDTPGNASFQRYTDQPSQPITFAGQALDWKYERTPTQEEIRKGLQ